MEHSPYSSVNEKLMQKICKKNKQSLQISCVLYDIPRSYCKKRSVEVADNEVIMESSKREISENPHQLCMTDIQAKLLQTNNVDCNLKHSIENLLPAEILCDKNLVLADDIFIKHCQEAIKLDSEYALLFSKLVLLPKINSLTGKVSGYVAEALSQFSMCHKHMVEEGCFDVLFSQENKGSLSALLDNIFSESTEELDSDFINIIISSMMKKAIIEETDLQTFLVVMKYTNLSNNNSLSSIVEYLEKCTPYFINSVRFGRCLLYFIQHCNLKMCDLNSLNFIVSLHKSSMKKALEIQMNRPPKL